MRELQWRCSYNLADNCVYVVHFGGVACDDGQSVRFNVSGFYFLLPKPPGAWVLGWLAMKSKALWIAGGMGGGVGKWAPAGWKPPARTKYKMVE